MLLTLMGLSGKMNGQSVSSAWAWAHMGIGTTGGYDEGQSTCTDINGNVYITGTFNSTSVTFGSYTLTNSGPQSTNDIYVVEYSSAGTVLWATSVGGTGNGTRNDAARSIATDGTSIVITGYFDNDYISFGSYQLTRVQSGSNFFVARLTNTGMTQTWDWAKTTSETAYAMGQGHEGKSVCTDNLGNVYVIGTFTSDDIQFGTITTFGNSNSGNGPDNPSDIFVVKYNNTGIEQWALIYGEESLVTIGLVDLNDEGNSITSDGSDVYITGTFRKEQLSDGFGNTALVNPNQTGGYGDLFVARLNGGTGSPVWITDQQSGGGYLSSEIGRSIKTHYDIVTGNVNVYVTGEFTGSTFTIMPTGSLTSAGNEDMFVAEYSASSGQPLYATSMGVSGRDWGSSISLDNYCNVYVVGGFLNQITLGSYSLTPDNTVSYMSNIYGPDNAFVIKYTPNFTSYGFVQNLASGSDDVIWICNDNIGNAYLSGDFMSSTISDNAPTITTPPTSTPVVLTQPNGSLETVFTAKYECKPLPIITVTPVTICEGQIATLTASGAELYTWMGGATASGLGTATATATATPSTTSTYTVTGTNSTGCSSTAVATVTVNELPIVAANTSSSSICIGDAVTLTGSGAGIGGSYTWSGGISDGVSFSPTGTTTYVVTGTDGNTCVNTASVTVTVNALPNVTVNSATICNGQSATLTGGGAGTGGTYTWSDGVSGSGTGGGTAVVTPTSTTSYVVTGTDANSCANTATATVTIDEPLGITLTTGTLSQNVCYSGTIGVGIFPTVYSITGDYTSTIITGLPNGVTGVDVTGTYTVNGLPNVAYQNTPNVFNYTLTAVSGNTCPDVSIAASITLNPIPDVTSVPTTVCSGQAANFVLSSNVAGASFEWTGSSIGSPLVTGSASIGFSGSGFSPIMETLTNPSNTVAGTVRYLVRPLAYGCYGFQILQAAITVNPTPVGESSPSTDVVCSGYSTNFALTTGAPGANVFTWTASTSSITDVSGFSSCSTGCTNPIAETLLNTGTIDQTVSYVVTPTAAGCVGSTFTVIATIPPIPSGNVSPGAITTICSGDYTNITLDGGNGATDFWWSATMNTGNVLENIAGGALSGSGSTISEVVTNASSTTDAVVDFEVTPNTGAPSYCAGTPFHVLLTVHPTPTLTLTSGDGSDVQSVCALSPISDITYAMGGATGVNVIGLPMGVTWNLSGGVLTISGNPSSPIGSYDYTVTTTGAISSECPDASVTGTIGVTGECEPCAMAISDYDFIYTAGTTYSSTIITNFGNPVVSNANIYIAGNLQITAGITFQNCNIRMGGVTSSIIVSGGGNLVITNQTHIYACGTNWSGIIHNSTTGWVKIEGSSIIEDALNAIKLGGGVAGGQHLYVHEAIFNKNKTTSIYFLGYTGPSFPADFISNSVFTCREIPTNLNTSYNPLVGTAIAPNPGTVNENIESATPWPGATVIGGAPISSIGINSTNVTNPLQIGDPSVSDNMNTFDFLTRGISFGAGTGFNGSTGRVYNNQFLNIATSTGTNTNAPIGVYAQNGRTIIIGGRTDYQRNWFTNVNTPIYTNTCQSTNVINNIINNSSSSLTGAGAKGVYIIPGANPALTTPVTLNVLVDHNVITNCINGIVIDRTGTAQNSIGYDAKGITITGNTITANSLGICNTGISFQDAGPFSTSPDKQLLISANTVTETKVCISALNVYSGLTISDNNTLQTKYTTPTGTGDGIKLSYCQKVTIARNNDITALNNTGTGAYANVGYKGIHIVNSPYCEEACNTISNYGESMTYEGSCVQSIVRNNVMSHGVSGLTLRNAAEIGTQGDATHPCGLTWDTNTGSGFSGTGTIGGQTFVSGTSNANSNSQLFLDNNPSNGFITFPTINGGSPLFQSYLAGLLSSAGTQYDCSMAMIAYSGNAKSGEQLDENLLIRLASDTTQYTEYEMQKHFENKSIAYEVLDMNNGNSGDTTGILQNFYDSTKVASLGKLKDVTKAIIGGDLGLAAYLNSSVYCNNIMESNLKTINYYYLLKTNDSTYEYSSEDSVAIYTIASQCVWEGGAGVWQARAMYNTLVGNVMEYDDDCVDLSKKTTIIKPNHRITNTRFNLFPNPNDGNMTLEYHLDSKETASVSICDVAGKRVLESTLNPLNSILEINESKLDAGVYFYKVIVNNQQLENKKIVIIK